MYRQIQTQRYTIENNTYTVKQTHMCVCYKHNQLPTFLANCIFTIKQVHLTTAFDVTEINFNFDTVHVKLILINQFHIDILNV